jgi:4-amino-4-deoxy-L-arabinose transferase-like glycosyltransferase
MVGWLKRNPLVLILFTSVLIRGGAALYLGNEVVPLPGTYDQVSYDALAQNVAAGKGFVFDADWYPFTMARTPTAHWSFLYVSYLAGVYAIVGYYPVIARLAQAVIVGVLMPWLVYRLGKRALGKTAGLAGAIGITFYIYLIYYSATLMTEPFYIVSLLWAIDVLQRIREHVYHQNEEPIKLQGWFIGRVSLWVECGAALGIATLLRQQALLLVPFFLGWLLWTTWERVKLQRLIYSIVLLMVIVALFILPWTVRNYIVYGEFLPLNSNVGWAIFVANHPLQGNHFDPLLGVALPDEWVGLNEAELNGKLMAAGIRFMLEDPIRFILQSLDRFRNYFRFWPEPTSSPIANVSRVLSFGLYLPFMIYGLILSIRRLWEKESPQRLAHNLTLLYLYVFIYSAMHLMSWAMHRYRLPVDAAMMVFVGLAWVDLYRRLPVHKGGK